MRNEITKIVKFNEYSEWTGEGKSVIGFKLERFEDASVGKISFEKVQGKDLSLENFVNLIVTDFDILKEIESYLEYERKEIFHVDIHEGESGCRRAVLSSNMSHIGLVTRRNRRCNLHVSMYDKVNLYDINGMWIGDLIEILRSLDEEFDYKLASSLFASRDDVRKLREYKYIKVLKPAEKLSLNGLLDLVQKDNKNFQYLFEGSCTLTPRGDLCKKPDVENLKNECYLVKIPHDTMEDHALIVRISRNNCFMIDQTKKVIEISLRKFNRIKSQNEILEKIDFWDYVKNSKNIEIDECPVIYPAVIKFSMDRKDINIRVYSGTRSIFDESELKSTLCFDTYTKKSHIIEF